MKKETQRKLTPAEEARRARFDQEKQALLDRGYEAHDLTMGIGYANRMTLLLSLPFLLLFGALYLLRTPDPWARIRDTVLGSSLTALALFLAGLLVLIVVHELLHGLTWSLFAESHWKAIAFGIMMKELTPYCSCGEPLGKWQYAAGAAMPLLVLGILPAALAVVTGSAALLLLGLLMILAAGGDMTILLFLLRFNPQGQELLCMDHPHEVGLVVFTR